MSIQAHSHARIPPGSFGRTYNHPPGYSRPGIPSSFTSASASTNASLPPRPRTPTATTAWDNQYPRYNEPIPPPQSSSSHAHPHCQYHCSIQHAGSSLGYVPMVDPQAQSHYCAAHPPHPLEHPPMIPSSSYHSHCHCQYHHDSHSSHSHSQLHWDSGRAYGPQPNPSAMSSEYSRRYATEPTLAPEHSHQYQFSSSQSHLHLQPSSSHPPSRPRSPAFVEDDSDESETEEAEPETDSDTYASSPAATTTSDESPSSPAIPSPSETDPNSISSLRKALSSIDTQLASLLSQRQEVESRLEMAVRQESPVYKLPSELLANIFVHGVLGSSSGPELGMTSLSEERGESRYGVAGRDYEEEDDQDALLVPVLMLVCKQWRQVVLSTPTLFSNIHISSLHDRSLAKARRNLIRSKSSPLSIRLNFFEQDNMMGMSPNGTMTRPRREEAGSEEQRSEQVTISRVIDLILPSFWRMKRFCLLVPTRKQAYEALVRCGEEQAPMLEELDVRVQHQVLGGDESHHLQHYHHTHHHTKGLSSASASLGVVKTSSASSSHYKSSYSTSSSSYSNPCLPLFGGVPLPSLLRCSLHSFNCGWSNKILTSSSNLRSLELSGYWNVYAPDVEVLLGILKSCERLEELVLRNMSDVDGGGDGDDTDSECGGGGSGLDAILGIECGYPSPVSDDESFMLSSRSLAISRSSIAAKKSSSSSKVAPARLSLPHLRKLTLNNSGILRSYLLLSAISFPSLNVLSLSYIPHKVEALLDRCISQSLIRLPLKVLRIESCGFGNSGEDFDIPFNGGGVGEKVLGRLLVKLGGLRELAIIDCEDVGRSVVKALTAAHPCLCPRLQSLNLDGCTNVNWESLRTLIESRLPSNPTRLPIPTAPSSSFSTSASASASAMSRDRERGLRSGSGTSSASASANAPPPPRQLQQIVPTTSASAVAARGPLTPTQASYHHLRHQHSQQVLGEQLPMPERLRYLDVTRCWQISKEMVQWLRMYVDEVRC